MNRDPLYRRIIEGLERLSDGQLFEECAVALIGKAYPNLTPMPGGNDAGMDGAFGTPDGAFPLICTIQDDVLGNFRHNITTYLEKRTGPRRSVIATSQRLSNLRKRNLEGEARKLGVTLAGIHDGAYFADQLYRDSKWRRELLGISGDSSALSSLPLVGRFSEPEMVFGRADVLERLQEVKNDVLIVGEPGSGKTFLHQHLAAKELCLFAVDQDRSRLADAIRNQQPSIIVVDDAHVYSQLVACLKRLRAELREMFQIHVNCWPSHERVVQRLLDIPQDRVIHLERLRKKQILELIEHVGIKGPDRLQHLLISQAEGKPGLAVALSELCKSKGVSEIWSGDAAARQLLGDSRIVSSERERCVLAAFSIGGDAGMSFTRISTILGMTVLELREITARLGSGGLVEEVGTERLQVRPPILRPVLVRDVFFGGPNSLPILPYLQETGSIAETATVLLGARQRGAAVPCELLEEFVRSAGNGDVWEHFAWVDQECTRVVLERYPDRVGHAAPGLLNYAPKETLHLLLNADDGLKRSKAGARSRIAKWLFEFGQAGGLTIERRRLLLDVLEERQLQGKLGDGETLAWALTEILQARFDEAWISPGDDREIRSIRGVLAHSELEGVGCLWPRVRDLLRFVPRRALRRIFDQVESWCLPQRLALGTSMPEATHKMVQERGKQMLSDILEHPNCNRAWRTHWHSIAKWAEFDLAIAVDPTYDALYARRDHSQEWQKEHSRRIEELSETAKGLEQRPMHSVLEYLADIRAEAIEFGENNQNGYLWVIYQFIADHSSNPGEWLSAVIERELPPEFVDHFVERLSRGNSAQYEVILRRLVDHAQYRVLGIGRILRRPDTSSDLLSRAINALDDPGLIDGFAIWRSDIRVSVMARLLTHASIKIRAAAAICEWQLEPAGSARQELTDAWRRAVLDVHPDHYVLKEMFEKDSVLAFEWLRHQLRESDRDLFIHHVGVSVAAVVVDRSQRSELLRLFTRKNYDDDLFDQILGKETDLFAEWFREQTDERLRLRPLDRDIDARWERMARIALDAGTTPDELAEHCTEPGYVWGAAPMSERFLQKIPAYEALANHADVRLQAAGRAGLKELKRNAENELERERRAETYSR